MLAEFGTAQPLLFSIFIIRMNEIELSEANRPTRNIVIKNEMPPPIPRVLGPWGQKDPKNHSLQIPKAGFNNTEFFPFSDSTAHGLGHRNFFDTKPFWMSSLSKYLDLHTQ